MSKPFCSKVEITISHFLILVLVIPNKKAFHLGHSFKFLLTEELFFSNSSHHLIATGMHLRPSNRLDMTAIDSWVKS